MQSAHAPGEGIIILIDRFVYRPFRMILRKNELEIIVMALPLKSNYIEFGQYYIGTWIEDSCSSFVWVLLPILKVG